MEIVKITAIGIVAAILSVAIKKQVPEFSLLISIAAGVIIFLMIIPKLATIIEIIQQIAEISKTDNLYILIILKIIGIAYISEFGSQICKDVGEGSIASKIELGGKALIMVASAPILLSLLNLIFTILP